MDTSRAIGALLCVVCVVIAVLHIAVGYLGWLGGTTAPLAFALPVTVGVLVITSLGFWLGWIMFGTKEVSPPPPPAPSVAESESEKEPEPKKEE